MKKLYALLLGLFCSLTSWGQTILSTGDVVILYMNPTGTDRFAFASLKAITAGTIINFTDNGFSSATTGRTGEGFLTFTAATNYPSGKVFSWVNGGSNPEFTPTNPGNFNLAQTGEQIFAFQGSTSTWAAQTGITLLFGINTGNAGFITTGSANANTSYLPSALSIGSNALQFPQANGYFANGSTATSSVDIPAGTTPSQVLALVADANKWYTSSSEITNTPTYSGAVLPVTYLNFQASYTAEKMVAVSWATAAETDNSHFDVERSADAANYINLGRVTGKGTITGRQTYTFTDEAPAVGWNYYRLRQVDQDGTASLSRPVAVLNENAFDNALTLMPNPASTTIRLSLAGRQVARQVSVVGLSGQRTALSVTDGDKLNVADLPAALYLLEVQTDTGRVLRQRLLKQ